MKFTQTQKKSLKATNLMPTDPSRTRRQDIATAAYCRVKARGSQPRYKLEEWLSAKVKFDKFV